MYREETEDQQKLDDFYLPFGGHLKEDNRWVILSKKIHGIRLNLTMRNSFLHQIWEHLLNHFEWHWAL